MRLPGWYIWWLAAISSSVVAGEKIALIGESGLKAWRAPAGEWQAARAISVDAVNPKKLAIEAGEGLLVNGAKGVTKNLLSEFEHGDVEAHIEFLVPKDSNSGVYFMGRYEIQILDSFEKTEVKSGDCGGVYASCSEPKPDFAGRPPLANASKTPGEWQSFDVVFRAPRFDADRKKIENARFVKVVHNGRVIHENVEVPRPTCAAHSLDEKPVGPLMLQGDHGPVAFRNIVLKPVELK
jgi:hypothetical protein